MQFGGSDFVAGRARRCRYVCGGEPVLWPRADPGGSDAGRHGITNQSLFARCRAMAAPLRPCHRPRRGGVVAPDAGRIAGSERHHRAYRFCHQYGGDASQPRRCGVAHAQGALFVADGGGFFADRRRRALQRIQRDLRHPCHAGAGGPLADAGGVGRLRNRLGVAVSAHIDCRGFWLCGAAYHRRGL